VRDSLLPVIRLDRRFGIPSRTGGSDASLLLVAESGAKRVCMVVDELIGKQEVVIKSLGDALKNTPGISGSAILGDGRVGLILDVDGVFGEHADS
jgi:two-component system, chemotaxis family, sensor kinase CheA